MIKLFQSTFCGHESFCKEYGNSQAMSTAKSNIDQWYPVVAILERMNDSLRVAEAILPNYFKGATKAYFKNKHSKGK